MLQIIYRQRKFELLKHYKKNAKYRRIQRRNIVNQRRKFNISDGIGDGIRLSDFRSSLSSRRRIQRQNLRHTFFGGESGGAGGSDGIRDGNSVADGDGIIIPSPSLPKKQKKKILIRRHSVARFLFFFKIKSLIFDQFRTYK